jgi:hypothetical protein
MKTSVSITGLQVKHLTMIFSDVFVPSKGRNEYIYSKPTWFVICYILFNWCLIWKHKCWQHCPKCCKREGRYQADTTKIPILFLFWLFLRVRLNNVPISFCYVRDKDI